MRPTKNGSQVRDHLRSLSRTIDRTIDVIRNEIAGTVALQNQDTMESYVETCKKAAEAHLQKRQSLPLYKQAFELAQDLAPGQVPPNDAVLIQFLICEQLLGLDDYLDIDEAIRGLQTIAQERARMLPVVFVLLARAFNLLNRYMIGREWVERGQDFIEKGLKFSKQYYPQTNDTIAITCREAMVEQLQVLANECKEHHPPDAVCRYEACLQVNSAHIAPSKDIFFSDPDFRGCNKLVCSERCVLFYHATCWKAWKGSVSFTGKVSDQAILGLTCLTPDCKGTFAVLEVTDANGQIKLTRTRKDSEKSVKQAELPSRRDAAVQLQRRRRDSEKSSKHMEMRRDSAKSESSNSSSPVVPVPAHDPAVQPNDVTQQTKAHPAPRIMVAEQNPAVQLNDVTPQCKAHPAPTITRAEHNPAVSNDVTPQPKAHRAHRIMRDAGAQVQPACCHRSTETSPDKRLEQVQQLNKQLEKCHDKYEKLRLKYMALLSKQETPTQDANKQEKIISYQQRKEAVRSWKKACEAMLRNWKNLAEEKNAILRIMQSMDSTFEDNIHVEAELIQSQFDDIHSQFLRKSMNVDSEMSLELPELPDQINIMPILSRLLMQLIKVNRDDPPASANLPTAIATAPALGPHYLPPAVQFNFPHQEAKPRFIPEASEISRLEAIARRAWAHAPADIIVSKNDTKLNDSAKFAPSQNAGQLTEYAKFSLQDRTLQHTDKNTCNGQLAALPAGLGEPQGKIVNGYSKVKQPQLIPALMPFSANTKQPLPLLSLPVSKPCLSVTGGQSKSVPSTPFMDSIVNPVSREYIFAKPEVSKPRETSPIAGLSGSIEVSKPLERILSTGSIGLTQASNTRDRSASLSGSAQASKPRDRLLSTGSSSSTGTFQPRERALSTTSVASQDSLASGASSCQPESPTVYTLLLQFLIRKFPVLSEEEIRRYLESMRKSNSSVFLTFSLQQIAVGLGVQFRKRGFRRSVVHNLNLPWVGRAAQSFPSDRRPDHGPAQRTAHGPDMHTTDVLECSICYDPLGGSEADPAQISILKCSHIYHTECLEQWTVSDRSCPMCRAHIISDQDFPQLK